MGNPFTWAYNRLGARVVRGMLDQAFSSEGQPSDERTIRTPAGSIRLLVHLPPGHDRAAPRRYPAHLDLHGGGYIAGRPEHDTWSCRHIADRTGAVVVSVDYAKAPEHPFPEGLEQCHAALRWLADEGDDGGARALHVDCRRLTIGGASAGGNLAAATCLLEAERRQLPADARLLLQVLLYPGLDKVTPYTDKLRRAREPSKALPAGLAALFVACYAPDEEARKNPLISPLLAPAERLRALPPALILTGDWDAYADEGDAYARRLREEGGVEVVHRRFERAVHGWTHFGPGSPDHNPQAREEAWGMVVERLGQAYARASEPA